MHRRLLLVLLQLQQHLLLGRLLLHLRLRLQLGRRIIMAVSRRRPPRIAHMAPTVSRLHTLRALCFLLLLSSLHANLVRFRFC